MIKFWRLAWILLLLLPGAYTQQYVISTLAGGVPPPTPALGLSMSVDPWAVAADGAGNIYFSGQASACVFKLDQAGVVTRVAGNGRTGFSGDSGTATEARLGTVIGLAPDDFGNLYITDLTNRIRMVSANGIITTVAGNGFSSFSGDGGSATQAGMSPWGVALDGAGNLYFTDVSMRIRKVSRSGLIETVAGNGTRGHSGDGGPAIDAALAVNSVNGLAVAQDGSIYFVTSGGEDNRLRKVSPDGIITTIAGTGPGVYGGDGGPAIEAQLRGPSAVAVDRAGNVFIADSQRVRKVSPDGKIVTFAGNSSAGPTRDGVPANSTWLQSVVGIAVDPGGNLFIGDGANAKLRKVSAGGIITTVAGTGYVSFSGDGGAATDAQLNLPLQLAVDRSGNLYVPDYSNARVRKISPDGKIVTIAGGAVSAIGRPAGVAVDQAGSIYIADTDNECIWKLAPDGVLAKFVGNAGGSIIPPTGGAPVKAGLFTPWGMTLDSAGNLYLADENDARVFKISTGGIIATVAGNGVEGLGGDGGPATSASMNWPRSVALDTAGNLLIADSTNHRIRKVSPDGLITTFAGGGGSLADGAQASTAALANTEAVVVDAAGTIFIADDQSIRRVDADGTMTRIAGDFSMDQYSGDGGPALGAGIYAYGMAISAGGTIYISQVPGAIRVLRPVSPAVQNAASNLAAPASPGEMITIYGSGIGPAQLTRGLPGSSGVYPTQVAGTVVEVNGIPAPIVYTSASQASVIVPYGITGDAAQIDVRYEDRSVAGFRVGIAPAALGVFTLDSSGKGQAAAVNSDGSINGPAKPIHPDDVISLYATGGGQTALGGIDGQVAWPPLAQPTLPVTALIGGRNVPPEYAGAAPGMIGGVMQINLRVPRDITVGDAVPVVVKVGNMPSQPSVTIAIR